MGIGGNELLLILLIVILLFGAKKIPELARGLGNGLKEFRKASNEVDNTSGSEQNQQKSEKNV